MPLNLVLVRHGESEGNVAVDRSKKGDHSAFNDPKFTSRHSSLWRLSAKGVAQATETGRWITANLGLRFDRHYTSAYIRAMETAGLLALPDAQWYEDFYLRERDWGALDRVSVEEREQKFAVAMKERKVDPFYWVPPNGTSLADLCLRIDRVIDTLHRECEGKNVIIVCHGEVMWAFRVRLERMSQEKFRKLDGSKKPYHRIHNCQVIHYTRTDPHTSGTTAPHPHLNWMRSICPWQLDLSGDGKWRKIQRKRYTNDELLERARQVPAVIV